MKQIIIIIIMIMSICLLTGCKSPNGISKSYKGFVVINKNSGGALDYIGLFDPLGKDYVRVYVNDTDFYKYKLNDTIK